MKLSNLSFFRKTIYVKRHNKEIELPNEIQIGNWIDLRAGERVELKANVPVKISLGVSIKLPKGYEALLAPRSGFFDHHKAIVANSIGIIDFSYCGDNDVWKLSVYPFIDSVVEVNQRICQFRILKSMGKVNIVETDKLSDKDRGGFHSTGKF